MYFRLLLLFIFTSFLSLQASQDVEVLAKSVERDGDIVHAKDEVVLYSEQYVITADEAFYNVQNGDLELLGNITILDGIEFSSRTGKADLNLRDKAGRMVPFFTYVGKSDLWLKCAEGTFDEKEYKAKKAIVSSCNVQNPDWKIGFSTGTLNKESKFMHLYNSTFYIKEVPVFYLPYFAFPTDKTRRSGLLRPEIGFGKGEGLYYLQPIFYAPAKNWDLEFRPQVRTSRGVGIHTTLRFLDSKYSKGKIKFGQFNERSGYADKNNLENNKHRGFSLYYDRSNLFSNLDDSRTEDGLLIDFQYLNDIDYLNTLDNEESSYNKLVTSKLNYYFTRDEDYWGLYAKYYIDTSKTSNKDTLQELPTFQYHRFLEPIFLDNLYYDIDYKTTNYEREKDSNALQHEINVPVSIYFPIFKDYLTFKFTENFYFTHVDYTNDSLVEDFGSFSKNYHTFSLFTELSKPYDDFYHTFYLGLDYILPGSSESKGFFESYIPINEDEESLNLNLVEYFYDSQGKKRVTHRLKQAFYFSNYQYKYGDLENYLQLFLTDEIVVSNTFNYSHRYAKATKIQTTIDMTLDEYNFGLTHTYENDNDIEDTNFISLDVDTKYASNYNYFSSLKYDLHDDFFKSWDIGIKYKTKCWNYTLKYKEDRTPKLTSAGSDFVIQRGVYLIFNLTQIGAVNYGFVKESEINE